MRLLNLTKEKCKELISQFPDYISESEELEIKKIETSEIVTKI
jgi:uncharacterized protein (DUF2164 family)